MEMDTQRFGQWVTPRHSGMKIMDGTTWKQEPSSVLNRIFTMKMNGCRHLKLGGIAWCQLMQDTDYWESE